MDTTESVDFSEILLVGNRLISFMHNNGLSFIFIEVDVVCVTIE